MDQLKIIYDSLGKTLTVYVDDPEKEDVCEETNDDLILIKDREGRVIGFERFNIELETQAEGLKIQTTFL